MTLTVDPEDGTVGADGGRVEVGAGGVALREANDDRHRGARERAEFGGHDRRVGRNRDRVWRIDIVSETTQGPFRAAQQTHARALAFSYAGTQMLNGVGAVTRPDGHLVSGNLHGFTREHVAI
jgi:hypothetical protein